MFKHYVVQALRSFWRFRVTAAVNLAGLVLALVCFIATYLYVESLLRSDEHFPKFSRIYVITQELWTSPTERMIPAFPQVGAPVGRFLRVDFPQLEAVARGLSLGPVAAAAEDRKLDVLVAGVDPDFLRIFDFKFLAGEPAAALGSTHSAIITEGAAERLFGTKQDVLGRRVLLQNHVEVTVTGLIATVPEPSHMAESAGFGNLPFEVLVPSDLLREMNGGGGFVIDPNNDVWGNDIFFTYVLMPANGSITAEQLAAALPAFAERRSPKDQLHSVFGVVPVSGIALANMNGLMSGAGLSITTAIFVLDALILAIACLNYANLAVAIATTRGKEIGMRKILGANRFHLMRQYLVEAALLALTAIVIVLAGAALAIGPLNRALDSHMQLAALLRPGMWGLVLGLIGTISLVGGAYPALVLSRVRPVEALRAGMVRTGPRFVPTVLVGIQFAAASFLLVMALLMVMQNRQIQRHGLNVQQDPVVVLTNNPAEAGVSFETLRAELVRDPHVKSVSASIAPPWTDGGWHFRLRRGAEEGGPTQITMFNQVSYDFFATVGLRVLAGRRLDREHGDEFVNFWTPRPPGKPDISIVIDRSLSRALGFASPNDAVNQMLYDGDMPALRSRGALRVVGVVEDGYPRLVGPNTSSNMYGLTPGNTPVTLVRISREAVPATLAHIDAVWASLAPKVPLRRQFMDVLFNSAYQRYAVTSSVLSGLAGFAFFIAVMGLCGMAIHVTSRRRREIGIRKTLGASARGVVLMLLRDFARPVVIANLVAWPFAFFAGRMYLDHFTQRAEISPWPFVVSLFITLAIAWAAVGVQALRAAAVKPANVLYAE